jgi:plastocyanin
MNKPLLAVKVLPRYSIRRAVILPFAAILLIAGCASDAGPGWTFASLGPTTAPAASPGGSAAASPGGSPAASPNGSAAASPAGSPGGSPAGSPGGSTTFDVSTPPDQPLAFAPAQLQMPAATSVTVDYLNDSNLLHNINFFAGPDSSAESLGATEQVTGPGALETVTFTTPDEPGDYFFWCDVHGAAMVGMYTVTP